MYRNNTNNPDKILAFNTLKRQTRAKHISTYITLRLTYEHAQGCTHTHTQLGKVLFFFCLAAHLLSSQP